MGYILQIKRKVLIPVLMLISSMGYAQQVIKPDVIQGKVHVKFKETLTSQLSSMRIAKVNGVAATGIARFDAVAAQYKATEIRPLFPSRPDREAAHRKHGLHLWYEVIINPNVDVNTTLRSFSDLDEVTIAEPVHATTLVEPGKFTETELASITTTASVNDPGLNQQWHYENDGSNNGILEADINLFAAWSKTMGSNHVIVSVHDQGVDVKHEDLAANIWVNTAEKNGQPGVDDDFNGYVDDVNGYDFVNNAGNIPAEEHGTHVAGTIAAVNNNGIGVAGVAGGSGANDGTRIMSMKGIGGNMAASFVYAADNGAIISQNSWTYTQPNVFDQAVMDAIGYFIEEAGYYTGSPMKGGLVIFAAGNYNTNAQYYPEASDAVLSVAALSRSNKKAYYSNYASWVDVAAPGGDQSQTYGGSIGGVLSTLPNNAYGFYQGTSMACPHVSGIAALVVAANGGSNFTNSDLWTHLVTGTHDIDSYNPDYVGLLGVGYMDAALALETNEGIGPNIVTDLTVHAVSQDFADLQWTTVGDQDDGTVFGYEIQYSNDVADLNTSRAKKLIINTKTAAGTLTSATIEDLIAQTQYYFTIRGFDRWGNRGTPSTTVTATTTDAPVISFDVVAKNLTLNAANNFVANDAFQVINSAVGALKWKAVVRQTKKYTISATDIPFHASLKTPSGFNVEGEVVAMDTIDYAIAPSDYDNNYVTKIWRDGEVNGSQYVIGDEDLEIPNSSATRYVVTDPNGFNLTKVNQLMKLNRNVFPNGVMEIYAGETMDKKNLVLSQSFQGATHDNSFTSSLTTDHQLFFEPGEVFWVVFHMPVGVLYPLGIGVEAEAGQSDNCFYSNDGGKSWVTLESVFGSGQYVWKQELRSEIYPLHEYLTLSPTEGVTPGNTQEQINVSLDGTGLMNGQYFASAVFYSNDDAHRVADVDFTVTVAGQKPKLEAETLVDFGSSFIGVPKTVTIPLNNLGLGAFVFSKALCTTSNPNFDLGGASKTGIPTNVASLNSGVLTIIYTPTVAGNISGVITLKDNKTPASTVVINVAGIGISPAQIGVTPASANYTMAVGDVQQGNLTISNTGNYPLSYYFPKFQNKTGVVVTPTNDNPYGYTWGTSVSSPGTITYEWDDIAATGTEISEFYRTSTAQTAFYEMDLGFEFPYFKSKFEKLYLTKFGVVTTHTNTGVVGNPIIIGNSTQNIQLSALNKRIYFEIAGKVYVQRKSGKYVVQFEDVQISSSGTRRLTFQMVFHDNGDIYYYYKGFTGLTGTLLIPDMACEDPERVFGFKPYDGTTSTPLVPQFTIAAMSAVKIYSPGVDAIKNLSSTSGVVPVGGSHNITFDVDATNLNEAVQYQRLAIASNDPASQYKVFTANIDVNAGGLENIVVSADDIHMGSIFQGDSIGAIIEIRNTGTKGVSLDALALTNGNFELIHDVIPFVVRPKSSFIMRVGHKGVNVGNFADVLTMNFSNDETKTVDLEINIAPPPGITLTYEPINDTQTIDGGEVDTHNIAVQNSGTADLEFSLSTGVDWAYITNSPASPTSKDYSYKTNLQPGGPAYRWEELIGDGEQLDNGTLPVWTGRKLPFTFEYYGNLYDSIYINSNAVLTFSASDTITLDFYNFQSTMGDPVGVNNTIAPYWGRGAYFHSLPYEETGSFYKEYSDRVIIEFANVYNVTNIGDPISIQVILYKNGTIKFQYKWRSAMTRSYFGTVGIENEDGTRGITVYAHSETVPDVLAIAFTPTNQYVVASGETLNFEVTVDAAPVIEGTYTTDFTVSTNVPGSQSLAIPASLTATGDVHIKSAEVLNFGNVLVKELPNLDIETTTIEFKISNVGTSSLAISSAELASGEFYSGELIFSRVCSILGCAEDKVTIGAAVSRSMTPGTQYIVKLVFDPITLSAFEAKDTLIINGGLASEVRIPIYANAFLPAVLAIDENEFHFEAPTKAYTNNGTITLDNSAGLSDLVFTVDLDYSRTSTEGAQAAATQYAGGTLEKVAASERSANMSISQTVFNREISYGTQVQDSRVGFGSGSAFIGATRFRADEQGFNLSHISTYFASENSTSSRIVVDIYSGAEIADAVFISSTEYIHNSATNFFDWATIELNEPFKAAPFETFWAVIRYPLGIGHPQAINVVGDLPNTFMYPNSGQWADIQDNSTFVTNGWLVKAHEETAASSGWITLSAYSGTIPAGQTGTINFNVFASNLAESNVQANILITGNDPYNKDEQVTVTMHLNRGPQFIQSVTNYSVNELEELVFSVNAVDFENESITYSLVEGPDNMSLVQTGATATITYYPDYNESGDYTVVVRATDTMGNSSDLEITVEVVDNIVLGAEVPAHEAVVIYPNPSSDFATVKTPERNAYALEVIDPSGRVVHQQTLNPQADVHTLDVRGFSRGLFAVKVQSKNGTYVSRIVKQ